MQTLPNPFDLDGCECCGAVATQVQMFTNEGEDFDSDQMQLRVSFACGASWTAQRRRKFNTKDPHFPHGDFTPWEVQREWHDTEQRAKCGNAEAVVRQMRKNLPAEACEVVHGDWTGPHRYIHGQCPNPHGV